MLSVIIPACNEENYIDTTLDSLYRQDFGNFEVIVVCNGCTDKTVSKARMYPVKVYSIKEKGVSKARNFGANIAAGKKLVFLDADVQLTENTLKKIFESKKGVGSCKAMPNVDRFIAKMFMQLKNIYQLSASKVGVSKGTSTGLIFCDKEVFNRVGGFEEWKTKGEDGDFIKRARKHAKFDVVDSYVINNMRRFEKTGYLGLVMFWIREGLSPTGEEYPIIR